VPEKILALERPDRALWHFYIISAILSGPLIFFTLPYLYFRYHTLRYRFDAEGIHMKVGLLFRQEINLTYARIQDIHLRSGIVQRWFGLANVEIQTASGSSAAELIIEGFKDYEAIRDFLYTRMRGYNLRPSAAAPEAGQSSPQVASTNLPPGQGVDADGEVVSLLLGIRDELRRTRELIETKNAETGEGPRNV